jgi:glycosyltransferase involved in cell wall biosynthesis
VRIGLVAPPWCQVPPPGYGGTEAVVDRLARGLAVAGHDVVLFTTGDSTCPVERRWVLSRAEPDRIGTPTLEVKHLAHAYAQAREFDVVHDHTWLGPLLAAGVSGPHLVATNHGPFHYDALRLYSWVHERVDVVAVSHDQARSAGPVRVAGVIHHGVDPERFPVGRGDGGYLAFLGRMAPGKGVHHAALVARRAGVPLRIAAKMREPAEAEYFDARVRPLLGNGVEYLGELGHREKVELLGGAVALVNPIQWPEPFGLVMIESLACGTPVLAFPWGAAPEIVTDGVNGFLCTDVDDMSDAVGRVAELDRAACRAPVEEYFCTERMVAEHVQLYAARRDGGPVGPLGPAAVVPRPSTRRGVAVSRPPVPAPAGRSPVPRS